MMSVVTPRELPPLAGQLGTATAVGKRNCVTRRTFLACAVLVPLVAGGCEENPERRAEMKAFRACYDAVWSYTRKLVMR